MNQVKRVYLDNASTTMVDDVVLNAMLPYFQESYGNPSSLHLEGRLTKSAIEQSRMKIAELIKADASEIIFTSGGTESDNLAILGIARANKSKGRHVITTLIEHDAVLGACKQLEKEGFEVTYLGVDKNGVISIEQLESSLRKDTILVSIMYANNEIGSIQPIKKASEIIKNSEISKPIFHCDACQGVGILNIAVDDLGIDALTMSASKIYGPKGIGCLYIRKNLLIESIIYGGGQEVGRRSGTENVASIVGFAAALGIIEDRRFMETERLLNLRAYFLSEILKNIEGVVVNGGMDERLPNNINISIRGVEGESLVLFLDNFGVASSTGSACSMVDLNPSHVLMAIGTPLDLAHCSVRFTLGRYTRKPDIDYAVDKLIESVARIRKMSSIK
jgi:cysteine desulfurase